MKLSGVFLENIGKRHSVIVGMTRSGKSYLTKHVLQQLQDQGYHTVFFDPKHDDDYASLGTICKTPLQFYHQLLKKNPAIVYRPSPKKDARVDELNKITEFLFAMSNKDGFKRIKRVVAIDEIQLMVKKGTNDGVETIWTVGAGIGVVGIAITQRIQLLNETCWSQSENKIIFKTDDRPEYLKSRNLDHYIDKREFFLDTQNKYWFYYTTGNGKWRIREPISASSTTNTIKQTTTTKKSTRKPKPISTLKTVEHFGLKRWDI